LPEEKLREEFIPLASAIFSIPSSFFNSSLLKKSTESFPLFKIKNL